MKKTISLIFLYLVVYNVSYAQNFSGDAIYKLTTKIDQKNSSFKEPVMKMLMSSLKNNLEVEYELSFNKNQSLYKKIDKISSPINPNMSNSSSDKFYKDILERNYQNQVEFLGKNFIITDKLDDFNWVLSSKETKIILGYECRKASTKIEIIGFKSESREIEVVAWYAISIPVSNGPDKFWGLPGLILEISTVAYDNICIEINLSYNDNLEIKIPEKGKEISQEDYDKVVIEKLNEIKKSYKRNN